MNDNVKRIAVANGPNIFQMLLVVLSVCNHVLLALRFVKVLLKSY